MYEKPIATFAERLKSAMSFNAVSAAEISRETGISTAAISHYVKGDYTPKQDRTLLISKFLKVNPAWLMGYDVDKEPTQSSIDNIMNDDVCNIVYDIIDAVDSQNKKLKRLLSSLDKLESDVQNEIKNNPFIEKYSQLSPINQQIINQTIDTLLRAQEGKQKAVGE